MSGFAADPLAEAAKVMIVKAVKDLKNVFIIYYLNYDYNPVIIIMIANLQKNGRIFSYPTIFQYLKSIKDYFSSTPFMIT